MSVKQNVVHAESNLPKVWRYVYSGSPFAIITAFRDEIDQKEKTYFEGESDLEINNRFNTSLLDSVGYGYVSFFLDGYWVENEDTPAEDGAKESCVFICGIEIAKKHFVKNILGLANKYNQKTFLMGDNKGFKIYSSNGDVLEDVGTINHEELGDVYRRMKGKGNRFVFQEERYGEHRSFLRAVFVQDGSDYNAIEKEMDILPGVWRHAGTRRQFAIITAHNDFVDDDMNEQKSMNLAEDATGLGYECLFMDGYWIHNEGTPYEKRFYETCLFVMGKERSEREFHRKRKFAQTMKKFACEYEREIVPSHPSGADDNRNKKIVDRIKELADECYQNDIVVEHRKFAQKMRKLADKYGQKRVLIQDNRGLNICATNGRVIYAHDYRLHSGMAGKFYRKMRNKKMKFVFEGERECAPVEICR